MRLDHTIARTGECAPTALSAPSFSRERCWVKTDHVSSSNPRIRHLHRRRRHPSDRRHRHPAHDPAALSRRATGVPAGVCLGSHLIDDLRRHAGVEDTSRITTVDVRQRWDRPEGIPSRGDIFGGLSVRLSTGKPTNTKWFEMPE